MSAAAPTVRLSEWIRAAEDTRLGRVFVCIIQSQEGDLDLGFDCDGFFGGSPSPGRDDLTDVVLCLESHQVRVYLAVGEGGLHARCLDPESLLATLDALAAERGADQLEGV